MPFRNVATTEGKRSPSTRTVSLSNPSPSAKNARQACLMPLLTTRTGASTRHERSITVFADFQHRQEGFLGNVYATDAFHAALAFFLLHKLHIGCCSSSLQNWPTVPLRLPTTYARS